MALLQRLLLSVNEHNILSTGETSLDEYIAFDAGVHYIEFFPK